MNTAFSMTNKLLGLTASLLLALPVHAELIALTGASVHPVSSEVIADGVVILRDGRIEAVGNGIEIPDEARRIELDGLHLYPGFVHPATQLGLSEISSVPGTVDTTEMGNINAAIRAEVAVNHDSKLLPVSIAGGILSAHIVPGGGLIRGTSAIINLDGWSWEEMLIAAPSGMHIDFPTGAVEDDANEDLALIENVLDQARHWRSAQIAAETGDAPAPPPNDQLEALVPLLDGDIPLMLHASRYDVMENALDWAESQALDRVILVANADAQYIAERLAADRIPVILRNVYALPTRRWEPYDMAFVAAARLHEAGVRFAIADAGSGMDLANARNLPFQAGSAAAHGLPREAALKSVTLWPAEILGVGDQLGSIEPGKRASLIATNGDPLEPMTRIERIWIDGDEFDRMRDRGRRLYERYQERNARAQGRQIDSQ
jgi:imidazolonepropionase-like amidohydrolase